VALFINNMLKINFTNNAWYDNFDENFSLEDVVHDIQGDNI